MSSMKKAIAVLLSLTMVFTVGGSFAYAETPGSSDAEIVTEDGLTITKAESVVDVSEATFAADNEKHYDVNLQDGTVTTPDKKKVSGGFKKLYGISYSEAGLKGKSAAKQEQQIEKLTDENELYSLDSVEGNTATVNSTYGSCRLIVRETGAIDTFGAESGAYFKDSYILRYPDEETTAQAYTELCEAYGPDRVIRDKLVKAEGTNWSYNYMKFSSVKSQIQNYGGDVLVAVIDTGIDFWHEAFENRWIEEGYDFVWGMSTAYDDEGHGTCVSSVITQSTGSNVGILPIKVLDENGEGWNDDIMFGVEYANEQNADVINMSLGGELIEWDPYDDWEIEEAQELLEYYDGWFQEFQGPVVVAAGNEDLDVDTWYAWPACSTQTIAVSALEYNSGNPRFDSDYSNYGKSIDFSAPGTGVYMADFWDGGYLYEDGTSFASPHIAAAAALIMANNRSLIKSSQVYASLRNISKDLGTSGKDNYYGYGCPILSSLSVNTGYYPRSIRRAYVEGIGDKTYNGEYIEFDPYALYVSVDGEYLSYGQDYTVVFENNRNVGLAKARIIGRGNYINEKDVYFKILPKGTSIKKLKKARKAITVKWKKQSAKMASSTISGYQIQVATNKSFTKNKKTKKVKGYSKTSYKMSKLKAKKKYYVRIRTYKTPANDRMGRTYYSKWSKVKSIKTK